MNNKNFLYSKSLPAYWKFVLIYTLFTIIIVIAVGFSSLSGFFSLSKEFINGFGVGVIIITIFSIIMIFYVQTQGYWSDINKYYLEHIPKEINIQEGSKYAGIIVANKDLGFFKYFDFYNTGILLLVEYLKNRGVPIKIVNNAEEENLKALIDDNLCNELYIIGHGRRSALRLHKCTLINYENFKGAQSKDRVEQITCCHKGGRSLAEVLGAEERFKCDKKRYSEDIIDCLLNQLIYDKT